jgi:hypothetical protein
MSTGNGTVPTAEQVAALFVLADSATRDKCNNDSEEARRCDAVAWQAYYTARDARNVALDAYYAASQALQEPAT